VKVLTLFSLVPRAGQGEDVKRG